MHRYVELGPADIDENRPFANVEHNSQDVAALTAMANRLRALLVDGEEPAPLAPCLPYELKSPTGGRLRVVVTQPETLRAGRDLPLVGFFGHRRPVVPPAIDVDKDTIDTELIAEFPDYPGVLSYCSMALNEADFGNLVVLAGPDSSDHWLTSARHAYAARVIAPKYYSTIRLHNGVLPGGLPSGQAPVLVRTKYYDYRNEWAWSAVREYGPA
jgi:hypothetical protein